MDIVALVSLATSVEEEAPLLAPEIGLGAYETALLLRTPSPIPLLRTDDRARVLDVLGKLRARRHDVVAFDASAVVASDAMLQVRSFSLEPDALSVASTERVPWSDIVALVRAMHETSSRRVEKTQQKRLSMGRAALSGGLLMTKNVTTERTVTADDREQVLYVFRRGGLPLLVSQLRTRYEGMGAELRPTSLENFAALVGLLRARARAAPYDERLLRPRPSAAPSAVAGLNSLASAAGMDLLAHAVALAIGRNSASR